jgi:hypothetical protein
MDGILRCRFQSPPEPHGKSSSPASPAGPSRFSPLIIVIGYRPFREEPMGMIGETRR